MLPIKKMVLPLLSSNLVVNFLRGGFMLKKLRLLRACVVVEVGVWMVGVPQLPLFSALPWLLFCGFLGWCFCGGSFGCGGLMAVLILLVLLVTVLAMPLFLHGLLVVHGC